MAKTVVITGANRGIGLEFVRQFLSLDHPPQVIIATCRDPEKATELTQLANLNPSVYVYKLDVADYDALPSLADKVNELVGDSGLDLLINNAGVHIRVSLFSGTPKDMMENFKINTIAPFMITRTLLPYFRKAATANSLRYPTIVNITSKMGSIDDNTTGSRYGYRGSKAALNMVTKSLNVDLETSRIKAVSIHPGWVKSDMGGPNAVLDSFVSVTNMIRVIDDVQKGNNKVVDITGGKAKTIALVLFDLFWSFGLIVLPGLSIFFNNWSQLYLVISLPSLVMVFLHRFIPDSPRWMLLHGRLKKSKEILLKSAQVNKKDVPEDLDNLLSTAAIMCYNQSKKEATWLSLWHHKKNLLPIYYSWAIFILLFNTMILNVSSFGQKFIHFNTVMMGFSEVIGTAIGLYLILYTRRKWIWVGLLNVVAGLCTYTAWLIPSTTTDIHRTGLAMIACIALKVTTSSAISILTASTADLVPPERKKILMLTAGIWGRAWILWAPFVGVLSKYGSLVPVSVMAMLTIIGGILCVFIGYRQLNKLTNNIKNTNIEMILKKENCNLLESKS